MFTQPFKFGRRSKKTSKLCFTGVCAGNSPGTGEFPAQMASNAENVSIWWRHHACIPSFSSYWKSFEDRVSVGFIYGYTRSSNELQWFDSDIWFNDDSTGDDRQGNMHWKFHCLSYAHTSHINQPSTHYTTIPHTEVHQCENYALCLRVIIAFQECCAKTPPSFSQPWYYTKYTSLTVTRDRPTS